MDKKNLDELLSTLGLYVRERKAGRWSRLQAGGSFRSYLDVWREGEGDWQVKNFGNDTWERRFEDLVDPTCEIADFLSERVAHFGDLDSEGANALNESPQHYKSTGIWLGLPKVPEDVITQIIDVSRIADGLSRANVFCEYLDSQWHGLEGDDLAFSWPTTRQAIDNDIKAVLPYPQGAKVQRRLLV